MEASGNVCFRLRIAGVPQIESPKPVVETTKKCFVAEGGVGAFFLKTETSPFMITFFQLILTVVF
jgi:hypothetical protein